MDTFSNRLRQAIKNMNLRQTDISRLTGIDKSLLSNYLSGNYKAKQENLHLLAKVLCVSEAWLMGYDVPMERAIINKTKGVNNGGNKPLVAIPIGEIVSLNIVASVTAGYGGEITEEYNDESDCVPATMLHGYAPSECRLFIVKGSSMYPKFIEGDKIIVHIQPSVDSGDTAIVIVNGDEGTIKKVKYVKGEDWVDLIPTNPEYQTHRISGADLEQCHIFGKVIGLLRNI